MDEVTFCPHCTSEVPGDVAYCPRCGSDLNCDSVQSVIPPPRSPPPPPRREVPAPRYRERVPWQPPRRSGPSVWVWILLFWLAMSLIAAIGLYVGSLALVWLGAGLGGFVLFFWVLWAVIRSAVRRD